MKKIILLAVLAIALSSCATNGLFGHGGISSSTNRRSTFGPSKLTSFNPIRTQQTPGQTALVIGNNRRNQPNSNGLVNNGRK